MQGSLFNKKIPGFISSNVKTILSDMNAIEKTKPKDKSTGQIMIEKKDPSNREYSVKTLLALRTFVLECPPVFTKDQRLGNLRKDCENNFVFENLQQFMGKQALTSYHFAYLVRNKIQ